LNNSIKLSSIASSYLEFLKPSLNNCQSDKLIVGNINDKLCINKFCSIINFKYENIDFSNIDSAYLYIYLDSMIYSDFAFKNITIYENMSETNLKEITWKNPPINSEKHIDSCLPFSFANHYVNINITSLYKFSNKNNCFSIIIDSTTSKNTSIVKFHSVNSLNPPYIILNLKDSYKENTINENIPYQNNVLKESDYDKVISELTLLNKKFDELKKETASLKKKLDKITIEPIELKKS